MTRFSASTASSRVGSKVVVDAGTDIETTRDLAGLSREMVLRYAHSTPASKRRAAAVIDGRAGDAGFAAELEKLYDEVASGRLEKADFLARISAMWAQSGHAKKAASS